MVKRVFLTVVCLLTVLLPAVAQSYIGTMTLEEKSSCVVGLRRKDFPAPTNNGIPGRTAHLPAYGIPSLVMADGTSGIRLSRKGEECSTAFPSSTSIASSWDQAIAREVGDAVGREALHYGVNIMLAPGMNIIRNPLCGRSFSGNQPHSCRYPGERAGPA